MTETETAPDYDPNAQKPPTSEDEAWAAVRARLSEEAERDTPPSWQPEEPGDELMGTVVRVNPAAPTAFGPRPVVELRTPVGEYVSLWLLSTVLRRAFERANVMIGETVLVRYKGKRERNDDPSYHDYKLVVDRPTSVGRVDWRTIAEANDDVDVLEHEAAMEAYAPPPSDEDIPF